MNSKPENTVKRLNRIEGQIRGISKMIEEDRYCIDILHQLQAVKAALIKVEDGILKNHANTCISHAIASGDARAQEQKFNELLELISKFKR